MSDKFATHKTNDEQFREFFEKCRAMIDDPLAVVTSFSFGDYRFNGGNVQIYVNEYKNYSLGVPVAEWVECLDNIMKEQEPTS